jgi:hypothetical protein
MPRFGSRSASMKHAALAIRVHSGWGALVAVAGNATAAEILKRSRIDIVDRKAAGVVQPYHFAQGLTLSAAERHLAKCAGSSEKLALEGIREAVEEIGREAAVAGCAILMGSGRALPELSKILASHPLIHTAEGEFFRRAFWRAAEQLEIPVTGFKERDLAQQARSLLGGAAADRTIANLGKAMGPPWTADQKLATLAGLLLLAGEGTVTDQLRSEPRP